MSVLNMPVTGRQHLRVPYQRHVRTGAAHIESYRIGKPAQVTDVAVCNGAGGNTGTRQARGLRADTLGRHHPTAAMEEQHIAGITTLSQPLLQTQGISPDHRVQHGVDDRGGKPVVLKDFGQDLSRRRDGHPRQFFFENGLQRPLVRYVCERVHKADGHRLVFTLAQFRRKRARLGNINRLLNPARGIGALRNRQAIPPCEYTAGGYHGRRPINLLSWTGQFR